MFDCIKNSNGKEYPSPSATSGDSGNAPMCGANIDGNNNISLRDADGAGAGAAGGAAGASLRDAVRRFDFAFAASTSGV